MATYKKMLVAFDGSESSVNALGQAISLAGRLHSWIKVVAVVPAYEGDLDMVGIGNLGEAMRGQSDKLLKAAEEIAKKRSASILTDVEQGEAYEKIVDVASEERCDLIVMGRRGLGRMERALMGSVTARVVALAATDVLVVPRGCTLDWMRMVLALDGSKQSKLALERAFDFASEFGGSVEAVTVVHYNAELMSEAPELMDKMEVVAMALMKEAEAEAVRRKVKFKTHIRRGEAAHEIAALAKELGAGSIFMGCRGLSRIAKLLMGSITEKTIGLAHCPVFVAKG